MLCIVLFSILQLFLKNFNCCLMEGPTVTGCVNVFTLVLFQLGCFSGHFSASALGGRRTNHSKGAPRAPAHKDNDDAVRQNPVRGDPCLCHRFPLRHILTARHQILHDHHRCAKLLHLSCLLVFSGFTNTGSSELVLSIAHICQRKKLRTLLRKRARHTSFTPTLQRRQSRHLSFGRRGFGPWLTVDNVR